MYLEEVLGIEGFLRPVNSSALQAQRETVVALSDVPLVNGSFELLKKMLASIQIHDFVAVDCARDDAEKLNDVTATSVVYLGESARAWPHADFVDVPSVQLPSLKDLTDTSDPARLQSLKKDTWAKLQLFAKEIS